MKTFSDIKVGDIVTRMLAGSVPMELQVTAVDEFIHCGPWKFSRKNGAEIDEELEWDEKGTGSIIKIPEEKYSGGSAIGDVLAKPPHTDQLMEVVKAGHELQKDLNVWMHFLARDIGTDRQDRMMESCPGIIELSEKFQKLYTALPDHLKKA